MEPWDGIHMRCLAHMRAVPQCVVYPEDSSVRSVRRCVSEDGLKRRDAEKNRQHCLPPASLLRVSAPPRISLRLFTQSRKRSFKIKKPHESVQCALECGDSSPLLFAAEPVAGTPRAPRPVQSGDESRRPKASAPPSTPVPKSHSISERRYKSCVRPAGKTKLSSVRDFRRASAPM